MILLDYHNRIIEEAIAARLAQAGDDKKDAVEITLADFDGVLMRVVAPPESRNIVTVSLQFDLHNLPADADKLPGKMALLKRHLLAGPFLAHFQAVAAGKPAPKPMYIQYRDDEGFFIKPGAEEVTVIFSIRFR